MTTTTGTTTTTITINGTDVTVPEGAAAYKYNDAVDGPRWIYDEGEADDLEREGAPLVWVEAAS